MALSLIDKTSSSTTGDGFRTNWFRKPTNFAGTAFRLAPEILNGIRLRTVVEE